MSGIGKTLGTIGGGVGGFMLGGPAGAMAGASLGGSLLGGGDTKQSGTSTTTATSAPWAGVQPYLLGTSQKNADGTTTQTPGLYQDAQKLYQGSRWTPQMQGLAGQQYGAIAGRTPGQLGQINALGQGLLGGQYDPNVQRVGNIAGAPQITAAPYRAAQAGAAQAGGPDAIRAGYVAPTDAFRSLGGADPTQSIQQMLSGRVNTSALDPVVNNAMRRMSDNFNEQVMPGINQGAVAAGQYGGSRQGIAQGLAAKGLALAQGDTAANLYNNAFNTAQSNMYGTANNMAGLGLSNAQGNANRDLAAQTANASNQLATQQFNAGALNNMSQFNAGAQNSASQFNAGQNLAAQTANAGNTLASQQFNANLGLQNNSQAMALSQQQLANRLQGLNLGQAGNQLTDQAYQQQLGLLQAPNSYDWQNLGQYNSLLTGGAQLGGTQTQSNPYYTNPVGNALGLASSAMGLYSGAKNVGLLGGGSGLSAGFDPWMGGGSAGSGFFMG